jgi:hypothetical protein
LEQSAGEQLPIKLEGGEERLFLQDGDSINVRGWAGDASSGLVGFEDCWGIIEPALALSRWVCDAKDEGVTWSCEHQIFQSFVGKTALHSVTGL